MEKNISIPSSQEIDARVRAAGINPDAIKNAKEFKAAVAAGTPEYLEAAAEGGYYDQALATIDTMAVVVDELAAVLAELGADDAATAAALNRVLAPVTVFSRAVAAVAVAKHRLAH